MKKYIKSSYERPYLYIFKHGIGPGTIPKDVSVVKTKDLPNYYTAVWLDRFLTTSELKQYDIPSETRINELLDRIGYCQKNGDVVPCDDVEACDKVTASSDIIHDVDYCIYFNGDIYDFDDSLELQIKKLKSLINDAISSGNVDTIDLAECQVTSVPLFIDKDGNTDYDWDNEEVEYCADADDDYAQYVKGSTDPKYMANMVSCSSYDSPYDDNDELYKYYVAGYLQKNLVGLMDEYYTNDFDDLLNKAVDMGPGLYLELTNQVTGDSVVITPDDLEEAAEYGEYPQSVYGIV